MGKFRLSKIELINYKLFTYKKIDFNNASLTVFDGPNGYGKTSIFEAVEYILTGTIKRAEESPKVNGTTAYNTHFLAKNVLEPVVVKGTFTAENNDCLEIERKLVVTEIEGKNNNPKNLKNVTKSKITYNGEVKCVDEKGAKVKKIIEKYLGKNIITYYDKFYYISQEDRLSFLMCSEQQRMNQIRVLFDMENEISQFEKFNSLKKDITSKIKSLRTKNENELKKVQEKKIKIALEKVEKKDSVDYEALIANENTRPFWDKQNIKIKDKNKLEEIYNDVKGVVEFTNQTYNFFNNKINESLELYINNQTKLNMYLFLLGYEKNLQALFENHNQYLEVNSYLIFLKESNDVDVEQLDFSKVKELLNIKSDLSEVDLLKRDIKKCRDNQGILATSLEKLQKARKNLTKTVKGWQDAGGMDISEMTCPYCKTDFKNKEAYDNAIKSVDEIFKNCTSNELKQIQDDIERLTEIYNADLKLEVDNYLQRNAIFKNDTVVKIFENWNTISEEFNIFIQFCDNKNILVRNYALDASQDAKWTEQTVEFSKILKQYLTIIPKDYFDMDEKYSFGSIYTKIYEGKKDNISKISEEQKNRKLKYIEEQYYMSVYNEIENEELDLKHNTIVIDKLKEMEKEIKEICSIYKDNIGNYQNKIIGKIKIPLYLYTGKILQSYQGGLGVYIKGEKKDEKSGNTSDIEKLESIRLLSPKQKEHDILYTLSSGQLSGVIIALTLTLNKFYGDGLFECLLIDDPVQTMDDLNIASLVEVLRNEFSEHQLIISTHEEDFSRYIRYKYEKYGLPVTCETLKENNFSEDNKNLN